jgi:hypothetical protein
LVFIFHFSFYIFFFFFGSGFGFGFGSGFGFYSVGTKSPSIEYFTNVIEPILKKFGAKFTLDVKKKYAFLLPTFFLLYFCSLRPVLFLIADPTSPQAVP